MAEDLLLRATIEAVLDARGFKSLDESLAKNRASMGETKASSAELQEGLGQLKAEFLGFLAIGALTAFYKEAVAGAAAQQRAWEDLGETLASIGRSADIDRIRGFIDSLSAQGVLDDYAIPAFTKFLGILRSVDGAEAATALAADIAARKHMDLGTAVDLVVNIIQGRMQGALRQLDIALVDDTGHVKTHGEAMAEVIKKYSGFLAKTEDVQKELDRSAVAWDNLSDTVGDTFGPAWVKVLGLLEWGMKTIQSIGVGLGGLIGQVLAFADGMKNVPNITKIFTAPKEFGRDMMLTMGAALKQMEAAGEATAEQFYEIWNKNIKKVGDSSAGLAKLEEQAALRDKAAAGAAADAASKAAIAAAQKRADAIRRIDENLSRSELEITARDTQAELDAEKKIIEARRKTARAEAVAAGLGAKELEKIDAAHNNMILAAEKKLAAALKKIDERIVEDEKQALLKELQAAIDADEKELASRKKTAAAEIALQQAVADSFQRYQSAKNSAVSAALGLGMQIAGQNKALAVALTTIETYVAAQLAYRDALQAGGVYAIPAAYAAAAAAVIAGLARVAAIEGVGFDDPKSDEASRIGGQRWAVDQVREFSSGAARGWKEAMTGAQFAASKQSSAVVTAPPNVVNRQSSFAPVTNTTVNISGFVGAGRTEMLKRLRRELDLVDRTVIRRSRVSGG